MCLLGLDLHRRHRHACSLHSEKRTAEKCKKVKKGKSKPQCYFTVKVPQSRERAVLLNVSVVRKERMQIHQPQMK